jgi:hypothetical protein
MSAPAEWLRDLVVGSRFVRDLPAYLRRPAYSAQSARAEVAARLAGRGEELLAMVDRSVFRRPASLYGRLFAHAGCEPGDLAALVRRDGVEAALERLRRAGVYLTGDEFKGRRPVVRGALTLAGGPDAVRNPRARLHLPLRSSGSRGSGTPVLMDLDYVRACAASTGAALDAAGAGSTRSAIWEVPGGGSIFRLLEFSAMGAPPERWFSHLPMNAPELHPRYRRSAVALAWGARLAGFRLPRPEHAPLDQPSAIVAWLRATLDAGASPLLFSMASAALRVLECAESSRVDLGGAWIVLAGEPVTAARLARLRAAGVRPLPRYGSIETGPIGYGCADPAEPDDLHVLDDLHALLEVPAGEGFALPAGALLLTSLRDSAPFAFINVSFGDSGVLTARRCGCALEQVGWTRHVHTVRSFEKLTGAGVNFHDADVIRVLEEVLPARFGGGSGDYQIVEHEGANGRPQLSLRMHPRLGEADTAEVRSLFLDSLGGAGAGSGEGGAARIMALTWHNAGLVEVVRAAPLATRTGKVLHVHRATSAV